MIYPRETDLFSDGQEQVGFTGWVGSACLPVLRMPSKAEKHNIISPLREKNLSQLIYCVSLLYPCHQV